MRSGISLKRTSAAMRGIPPTRSGIFKFGKRKPVIAGPTLDESKFAIGITAVMILLATSFFYMVFHFPYPSDIFDDTNQDRNASTIENRTSSSTSQVWPLTLTSPVFRETGGIPARYMCGGGTNDELPPLQWSNVPKQTTTFALIVHDLEPLPQNGVDDIPRRTIWNIPTSTTQLSGADELPDGAYENPDPSGDGANSRHKAPCRHQGVSVEYVFELFALDQKLDRSSGATYDELLKQMQGHITGHAKLRGLSRK